MTRGARQTAPDSLGEGYQKAGGVHERQRISRDLDEFRRGFVAVQGCECRSQFLDGVRLAVPGELPQATRGCAEKVDISRRAVIDDPFG